MPCPERETSTVNGKKQCRAFRAITDANSAQGQYALALFDSTLA
jgi:hypothetical protein